LLDDEIVTFIALMSMTSRNSLKDIISFLSQKIVVSIKGEDGNQARHCEAFWLFHI